MNENVKATKKLKRKWSCDSIHSAGFKRLSSFSPRVGILVYIRRESECFCVMFASVYVQPWIYDATMFDDPTLINCCCNGVLDRLWVLFVSLLRIAWIVLGRIAETLSLELRGMDYFHSGKVVNGLFFPLLFHLFFFEIFCAENFRYLVVMGFDEASLLFPFFAKKKKKSVDKVLLKNARSFKGRRKTKAMQKCRSIK